MTFGLGTFQPVRGPEGSLWRDLEEFQRDLQRIDRAAMGNLASAYRGMQPDFRETISALDQRIRTAAASGLQPSASWVMQHERYRALEQQVLANSARLSIIAGGTAQTAQQAALTAQNKFYERLASGLAAYGDTGGIDTWATLPTRALESYVGTSAQLLRKFAGESGVAAVNAVRETMLSHIAMGRPARVTAKLMQSRVAGLTLTRAMTITRTETARARRAAAIATFQQNPAVRGWVWRAGLDRSCPACIALHGEEFETDDFQAGHPNCRCVMVPMRHRGTNPNVGTGTDYLFQQSQIPGGLERVLGKGRADWWRNAVRERRNDFGVPASVAGREVTARLATFRPNTTWGGMYRPMSLQSLRQGLTPMRAARSRPGAPPRLTPQPAPAPLSRAAPRPPSTPTVPMQSPAVTGLAAPGEVTTVAGLKTYLSKTIGTRVTDAPTKMAPRTAQAMADGAYRATRDIRDDVRQAVWQRTSLKATTGDPRNANAWWRDWRNEMTLPASRWDQPKFWSNNKYGIQSNWHAGSTDARSVDYWVGRRTVVHEFGHGLDYYARRGGYSSGHSRRWAQFFDTPSTLPSKYAAHNEKEHAAEMYAALQTVKEADWSDALRTFDKLVDPFRRVRKYDDAAWEDAVGAMTGDPYGY